MFGEAFVDSDPEDEALEADGDPNDPNAPEGKTVGGKGKPLAGGAGGNLFEARFAKLDAKIQHIADALGSTMSKKDRAKLFAGLEDLDAQDMSLAGDGSSHISPESSVSKSEKRAFNSIMLDYKEENQHEMQGLWAAIKKL